MKIANNILKNTSFLVVGEAVSKLFLFILIIYLARKLGGVELGRYSFIFAFTLLFFVFTDIGLSQLTIRDVARDNRRLNEYFKKIITVKILFSVITFILIMIIINILNYPKETVYMVYIAGIYMIIDSFVYFFNSILRAHQQMFYEAILLITEKTIILSLGLYAIFYIGSLMSLMFVFLIAVFIKFIISLLVIQIKFKQNLRLDFNFADLIKIAFPFAMIFMFNIIYTRIDIIMISLMKGDLDVGLYNASYNIIFALMIIPATFTTSLFPLLSRFFINNKASFLNLFEKSIKLLVMISIPLTIGAILLSDKIITFVYGNGFKESAIVLKLLSLLVIINFINYLLITVLTSINKEKIINKYLIYAAISNIILNSILIPIYSYNGAAIATIIVMTGMIIGFYHKIIKLGYKIKLFRNFLKSLISACIMGIVTVSLIRQSLFISIPISAFTYFIILFIIRFFDKKDILLIKEIIQGIKSYGVK